MGRITANNNSVTTSIKVLPLAANLHLRVTDLPDPVRVGASLTYSMEVINLGPDAATHVRLDHIITGHVVYNSVTAGQGTCGEQTYFTVPQQPQPYSGTICELGTVAAGSTATVVFVITPQAVETLRTQTNLRSPEAIRPSFLTNALQKATTTRVTVR